VFHGLRAPPISIEAYLVRIAKYAKCSPACFVHSMVHMLKLAQQDASFAPTRLNVHRLLLTGVLISAKFLDDRYFNNAFYAKVGSDGLRAVSAALIYCSAPAVAALCAQVGFSVHTCLLLFVAVILHIMGLMVAWVVCCPSACAKAQHRAAK
jgi:hypothetical protein